jgi:ribose transport system substrate-binding protein
VFGTLRRGSAAAAVLLATLLLAACGSDSTNSGSAGSSGASAETTSANGEFAALQKKLDTLKAPPEFTHPGPEIDVTSLKGKTFYVIPLAYNTEFNKLQADATVVAGKAAGVDVKVYSTTGTPSQWQQGMQRAIADDAAAIILQGPDPNLLIPQIRQAKAKGIPVISSHYVDQDVAEEVKSKIPNLEIAVPGPFTEASRLLADHVTVESGGKANVVYVPLNDFGTLQKQMTEAFKQELSSVCPDCKLTRADTTLAKVTETPSAITSAMRRDPKIDWIVPAFDLSVPYAETALQTLRKTDETKIASFNATTAVLKLMQQGGNPLVADIGEPIPVMGYTSLDQAMRLALDKQPVDEPVFMRMFTKENVDQAGTPPTAVGGYGDAQSFVDGYKRLWGVG